MRIRRANITDAANISNLLIRVTTDFIIGDCTKQGAEILLNSMKTTVIESHLIAGDRYYLAEQNDQLVGVIGVRSKTHLFHLFVEPLNHNQGVGRSLWNALVTQPPQVSTMTVNSSLNSVGFYQKLGFIVESSEVEKNGIRSIPMNITFK